jgi:hypothetical protein
MSRPRFRHGSRNRAATPPRHGATTAVPQLETRSCHDDLDLGCRGFRIDSTEVDNPRLSMWSIDAWISRP